MAYEPFSLGTGNTDAKSGTGFAEDSNNLGTTANFLGGDSGGNSGGDSGGTGSDNTVFDPERHAGPDKRNRDGSYRLKRGRKPGSTSANRNRTKADHQASIEGLTRILSIVHLGIASATKTPEMALDDEEAKNLAAATATVLQEFDIRPDPKVEAIVGLITAAGMVYGPRVYLITERKKKEAKEKRS